MSKCIYMGSGSGERGSDSCSKFSKGGGEKAGCVCLRNVSYASIIWCTILLLWSVADLVHFGSILNLRADFYTIVSAAYIIGCLQSSPPEVADDSENIYIGGGGGGGGGGDGGGLGIFWCACFWLHTLKDMGVGRWDVGGGGGGGWG